MDFQEKINDIRKFIINEIKSQDSQWSSDDDFYQTNNLSLRKEDGKWQVRLKKSEKGNYHDLSDIGISKWYLIFLIYFYINPQIKKNKKSIKSLSIIEEWNSIGKEVVDTNKKIRKSWKRK